MALCSGDRGCNLQGGGQGNNQDKEAKHKVLERRERSDREDQVGADEGGGGVIVFNHRRCDTRPSQDCLDNNTREDPASPA